MCVNLQRLDIRCLLHNFWYFFTSFVFINPKIAALFNDSISFTFAKATKLLISFVM